MDGTQNMNCQAAQERILESFDSELSAAEKEELQQHCSDCATCTVFMAAQEDLDLHLREQITAPELGPRFRDEILARVARAPHNPLPSWLPDAAYIAGSAAGLAVCAAALPFPVQAIITVGRITIGFVYLLQTFFLGFIEEPD